MQAIRPYTLEIALGLAALVVLQCVLVLVINARLNRLSKLVRSLFTGPSGEDLESMLRRCLQESGQALRRTDDLDQGLTRLGDQVQNCVQQIGIVRYDAYGDVSGDQSFSLAVLDARGNGAVVSGLFGRHDGRCYGKAVVAGQPQQMLTEEENAAVEMANGGGLRTFGAPATNGRKERGRPLVGRR